MPDEFDTNTQQPLATPPGPPVPPVVAPAPLAPPQAPQAGAQARRPMVSDLDEETLAARLERERKRGQEEATAKLLKSLGYASPEDARAAKAKADESAAEIDKRRKAEMTEIDRLKAELEMANKRAAELQAAKEALEQEQAAAQADQTFTRAAQKHVDPSMVDAARLLLASEIRRRARDEPDEEFTERDAERFFKRLAVSNPRFAVQAADAGAPAQPPPVRRVITTGAPPSRSAAPGQPKPAPVPPTMDRSGKTFLPGEANSMSRAEAVAAARRDGYSI